MAEGKPKMKTRWPWSRIVLAVSLALNLGVAGLVIGAQVQGPRRPAPEHSLRDLGFGPFVGALPDDVRDALAASMRREAGHFDQRRAQLRQQFDGFLAALRQEPYDPAAVAAIVSQQQDAIFEAQRMGRGLLLEQINAMSPEARNAYADALERGIRRWKAGKPRD